MITVALERPKENNTIDVGMAAELWDVCRELATDSEVRVVIFTGSGTVFSTGRSIFPEPDVITELQVASCVAAIPVPVLMALNGDATDHGLELALAGDLRIAGPTITMGFSPPSAGSLPFDGGTQRLPRLVGPAWARDLLLTGRRVSAGEALAIGLVNRVAGPGEAAMDAAQKLASEIIQGSPLGARFVKEAVRGGQDMTLDKALGLEADLNIILQSTSDRAEGIASFMEKRTPEFTGE